MLLSMLQQQSYGEVSNQQSSQAVYFQFKLCMLFQWFTALILIFLLISFSNVTLSIEMGHFKVLYVIHLFDIKWHFHCWLENLKKKKFCIKIFIFKLFGSCMCKMWIKQAFTFSFKKLIMWFTCINLQDKWLPCIILQIVYGYHASLYNCRIFMHELIILLDLICWNFQNCCIHFPRILAW